MFMFEGGKLSSIFNKDLVMKWSEKLENSRFFTRQQVLYLIWKDSFWRLLITCKDHENCMMDSSVNIKSNGSIEIGVSSQSVDTTGPRLEVSQSVYICETYIVERIK
ncbi:hypothetical protein PHYBLDRAFT_70757 [Phycomyces blakesleeanus NRRL 1555(-)]|uniref:Uncharacterized protein n=1 Tax=Phycomyces blakesleeanus (strain ATCC 8743b / DSM 1359 / FGSC 10004 / NBRC 33097 / NRRL 1555) TaxID=763407 RepID=A0A162W9I8_PHYB8|nr:hypothetical protein PHYBLDRAFT_70757 [Phycomyces blakesleeanus NRRL 1555(-)]OAD65635.1 hypothetical protein PHYBLDRAFT_70757 [Phycomyces blakesleeanus NRRL 1555(-)]|eukprot:XP_018283675.1 hypothetical protein PHYBLDRAFT_70757 [Phycomyces blakesleeanus NRRL 1555(-)]